MAGERLLPPLIVIASVVLIGGLLIGLMSPIIESNQQSGEKPIPSDIMGETLFTWWTPSGGRAITWSNATNNSIRSTSYMMQYHSGTDVMYVDIVRNNSYYLAGSSDWYRKYFDFVRLVHSGGNVAISYSSIDNATLSSGALADSSLVAVFFPYDLTNYTLRLEFSPPDYSHDLWTENDFQLYIGVATSANADTNDINAWNFAFKLATFQLQLTGVEPIDFIFSVVFDMMVSFIVLMLFIRAIHGGG